MDHALLRADEEQMLLVGIKVEAHTASKAIHERLLLAVSLLLFVVLDQLKLNDLFSLELVLEQVPVCDSAITGNRVETQILGSVVLVPAHLPDGVGVLVSAHSGVMDWLATILGTDIENHHCSVVAACCNQSGVIGVEVDATDA